MIHFSKIKHGDELLNLFVSTNRYLSIEELQNRLKLSRRSIFYVIKKVNIELEKKGIEHVQRIGGAGYYLTPDSVDKLRESKLVSNRSSNFVLGRLERKNLIIWKLINNEVVSLLKIAELLNISKNTAIKDMKNVTESLKRYGLKLVKSKDGRKIEGPEELQRNWVYGQLSMHSSLVYSQLANDPIKLSEINTYLNSFEKATGNYLTDDAIMITSTFILWYLNRVKNEEKLMTCNLDGDENRKYAGFRCTKQFLSSNGILSDAEACYIVKMINSSQFSKINREDITIKKLIPITRATVDRFNQVSGVSIPPENLEISLTTHLLSTYNRVKYNILYKHPNLRQIEDEYNRLFTLTRYSVKYFEEFISRSLSDDEIALIALYFGSELRKLEEKTLKKEKIDVFVVCSSGIGTSIALEQQLKVRYPQVKFSSPMSVLKYESSSLSGIKLVISTIDLQERKHIPVIQVSAIPDQMEWGNITKAIYKSGLSTGKKSSVNVENIIDVISNYARIEDVSGLKKSLDNYFSNQKQDETFKSRDNFDLSDLMSCNHISICTKSILFDEAVKMAYKPLLEENKIEDRYVEEIISLTKEHGPYMVLGKGIMLAHAKPSDGVNSIGMCLMLLKQCVEIPQIKNDKSVKVKLIVGLAPVDSVSHLKALSNLMSKIQNYEWLDSIYKCNTLKELRGCIFS